MKMKTTGIAVWLRIACAILMLSLGFGHKPVFAASAFDPSSSYYLLPDGTFADLCIGNSGHGKPEKSWFRSGCDLCRLAGAVLLPAPPTDHGRAPTDYRPVAFQARLAPAGEAIHRPGAPVRGPPASLA